MIHTLTDKAIAVEVKPDWTKFYVWGAGGKLQYFEGDHPIFGIIDLPEGNWQILGRPASITLEQAKEIIPFHLGESGKYDAGYWDYDKMDVSCDYMVNANSALSSFQSLLKSKNISPDKVIILIKQ
jgi:hypothetical protein